MRKGNEVKPDVVVVTETKNNNAEIKRKTNVPKSLLINKKGERKED